MIDMQRERAQQVLDAASLGRLDRRRFIALSMAVGLVGIVGREAVAQAAAAGAKQSSNRASLAKAYDYVIVGAGAAGCVLARRLVDHGATVLLIEAGGTDQQSSITEPSVWFTNIGGANDWGRTTVAQPQLGNRELLIATGKVLGGGSSINGCVWSRGSPHDFDSWAYEGCYGWSFADVLPVYRSIENWEGGASEWRGDQCRQQRTTSQAQRSEPGRHEPTSLSQVCLYATNAPQGDRAHGNSYAADVG